MVSRSPTVRMSGLERMQKTIGVERDPESVLLARVYRLILSWDDVETDQADATNAPKPNAKNGRKRDQEKDNAGK